MGNGSVPDGYPATEPFEATASCRQNATCVLGIPLELSAVVSDTYF
jgi:hypothetical protein